MTLDQYDKTIDLHIDDLIRLQNDLHTNKATMYEALKLTKKWTKEFLYEIQQQLEQQSEIDGGETWTTENLHKD